MDLRIAFRRLIQDRVFTLTALATLAVCIAANTAMFSIVYGVVLAPLPWPDADRLVVIFKSYPDAGAPRTGNSVPDYVDRQSGMPALDAHALYRTTSLTIDDNGAPERVAALVGTESFFDLMGASVLAGRGFADRDRVVGEDAKVILGHSFWQRRFGGDTAVVGRVLQVNSTSHEIVGVLSEPLTFPSTEVDLLLPAAFRSNEQSVNARHSNTWQMIGRLAPGATLSQVQQQLDAIDANAVELYPQFKPLLAASGYRTRATLLRNDLVREVGTGLYLLWGGVALVLVIGCVNIGNLVMIRATARVGEWATRQALGATKARLVHAVVTESMLVAAAGGLVGMVAGAALLASVRALGLDDLPRGDEIHVNVVTVLVTTGVTIVAGLVIGLLPAWRLARVAVADGLRGRGRGAASNVAGSKWRRALAITQVALAFVLMVSAGLMFGSLRAVLRVDLGFVPDGLMTAGLSLPTPDYPDTAAVLAFADGLLTDLRQAPGITSAALTSAVPWSGSVAQSLIFAEGAPVRDGESPIAPWVTITTPGYFTTMGMTLEGGRDFDARDAVAGAPMVAILDATLAERYWPGQDAVGRRLYRGGGGATMTAPGPNTRFITVVGVVRPALLVDPKADLVSPGAYYLPMAQAPSRTPTIVARGEGDPGDVVGAIRRAVEARDPRLPVFRVRSMSEWMGSALMMRRLFTLIAAGFGVVGLLLSALGVYGVLASGVAQREREFGVRLALGSTAARLSQLVFYEGLIVVGVGLVVGGAGASVVGRVLRHLLYGVATTDLSVFASVAGLLSVVALMACVIPMWRASRVDPMAALRSWEV